MPGKVIFLNGTSSAGKTIIAELLQKQLKDPYLILTTHCHQHSGGNTHDLQTLIKATGAFWPTN